MNVLVVPMFARSRMSGPWSRAQAIAAAFERAGHRVVLGVSQDGNSHNPCVTETVDLPTPSPLGLPAAISSRTFPIAEKLGIMGRKPVRSFEEVLWLTGTLSPAYMRESVSAIANIITERHIDVVYSEFSVPAIVAARLAGAPAFGSFSYTTQTSYASNPEKASGIPKLLTELVLPSVTSSLELFDWLEAKFVPSCPALEPIDDAKTRFVGFLQQPPSASTEKRDYIVMYPGSGSVPQKTVERSVLEAFSNAGFDVFVAGMKREHKEGNIHFASRFNFSQLLPRARCFVHHGGQNSVMDALAYETPQVIVPGHIFERQFNARSIEQAGAGIALERLDAGALTQTIERIKRDSSFSKAAHALHAELASLGGANAIVREIEGACLRRQCR